MNKEDKEKLAMQLAKLAYPDHEIVSAMLDEQGTLHANIRLNKPIHYIQFTTEVKDA